MKTNQRRGSIIRLSFPDNTYFNPTDSVALMVLLSLLVFIVFRDLASSSHYSEEPTIITFIRHHSS
jgi:hypothetical protein